MLFFAYDLDEYIATRDFYVPFETFVPGRIVRTFPELLDAIRRDDYQVDKVAAFAARHFAHHDSGSTDRVIDQLVLGRAVLPMSGLVLTVGWERPQFTVRIGSTGEPLRADAFSRPGRPGRRSGCTRRALGETATSSNFGSTSPSDRASARSCPGAGGSG